MSQAPTAHDLNEQESPEQAPAAEIRVIDPGAPHLMLLWQAHDGHGHHANGQLAGAPPEPEVAAWRYPTRRDGLIPVGGAVLMLPGGDWLACPACHRLVGILHGCLRHHLPYDEQLAWPTSAAAAAA